MKRTLTIILVTFIVFIANNLQARPLPGFKEGPYLLFGGGLMNLDYDNNARTGTKVGDDFEPSPTFIFGWDISDRWGIELQGRYVNAETFAKREHAAGVNINCTYHLILDFLTDLNEWHILPFIKAGPGIQMATVPADAATSENYLLTTGIGGNVAGGIHVLYKYLYGGIELYEEFLNVGSKNQLIGGTSQQIIKGGFNSLFNAYILVGVHF